ncbi:MAG: RdgB/HAM1 family non-canonical purine NTP pyrophosphatase [Pseudomonadota bacterium]|nr:RdgB/HAM1 family non-canonical purine NTP pyrophosphatase [Pseudomonadota bacterium]
MADRRPEKPSRIVLATGNAGKLREIEALLQPAGWNIVSQKAFDVPEAEETGLTFIENAILKARNAVQHTGLPAIADDSGLEVDALHGQPGIYSARFAGGDDRDNTAKVLELLGDLPDEERGARFCCVMVYLRHVEDPSPVICEGAWEGCITLRPSGNNGFGYDPVFLVPDEGCTAAELPPETKNLLSHRGQALRKLARALAD